MQRATKNKCSSSLLQAGSNIRCTTTPRTARGGAAGVAAVGAGTGGVAAGPKTNHAKAHDAGKKPQVAQRMSVEAMRAAGNAAAAAAAKQRQIAAEAAAIKRHSASAVARNRGRNAATVKLGGAAGVAGSSSGVGTAAAAAATSARSSVKGGRASQEAKPKLTRNQDVHGKQLSKKQPQTQQPQPLPRPPPPSPVAKKLKNPKPELSYPQPSFMGPDEGQVLTKPRRAYNTLKRFFVPLLKLTTPLDFQQLRPAGQRYLQKLQRDQADEERSKAEMRHLVEATRSLLPQWLPLDELVPPPPEFADKNEEDHNAWRYRINRTDTVTLCNFPTLERQMLVREYAGHLQS